MFTRRLATKASSARALSTTSHNLSKAPALADVQIDTHHVFDQRQKDFRADLAARAKRDREQHERERLEKDAAKQKRVGSGPISKLIYGTEEGRKMDQDIERSFSQVLARGKYVHSVVFHEVKPDKVEEYVELVGGWYPRMAGMPENKVNLVGSWRTEVGDCDTFVHIWEYQRYAGYHASLHAIQSHPEFAEFDRKLKTLISSKKTSLMQEFSFWPTSPPRQLGGVFELRTYTLHPGNLLEWEHHWRKGLEARKEVMEGVGAWFVQIGALNEVHHLWQFPDLQERKGRREQSWGQAGWAETVHRTVPLIQKMNSRIMLEKLKEYKYSAVDRSLLSQYVLKPYWWSQVIKLFPLSMAPNAITLTGFGFVIVNILTMLYYTPTLDQDCPSWVYASWSIGLFLYQTFDAIDGSQARRTKQSGPLGELFDHGVDALNTSLEVLLFAAAMNFGHGWRTVVVLFGSLLTFYVQTWDEYHTKTLTLGVVSGPVEGILALVAVYAVTAYMGGGSYWQQPMLPALGVPYVSVLPKAFYRMDFGDFYMVYGTLVLGFNTVESARNVMKSRKERGEEPTEALLGLLPFAGTWACIVSYLYLHPEILHAHIVPFVFFVGLINAYSVGQMITAHLTKSSFPFQNILALPLLYAVIDSLGPILEDKIGFGWPSALGDGVYQVAFMFSCLGLAIGVYGSFVVDVIVSICDYLDIWCLTIKHPATEEVKKGQ
ncbi:hypothetical protein B0A48_17030 [Cryoendolithus antarcticus]|uniref:diacylglycerol cholinephosphotransferase n=1 Tax=Cryoendolithus antarcticus TaxID=1507870 RepID=A0A1V8SCG1_9PEZI|nr:hypothetical protein B0A48_17030 [Cryoendolithus antarcticus]